MIPRIILRADISASGSYSTDSCLCFRRMHVSQDAGALYAVLVVCKDFAVL